ncbi:MAG: hypothetical protein IT285_10065 [Bdellovibrionales bacterium]|nr:hypothetical protein [Bdellovibrionales bacterium]
MRISSDLLASAFPAFLGLILSSTAFAADPAPETSTTLPIGIRGGIGTDITGSLAYGAGLNYLAELGGSGLEAGIVIFGGSFTETTTEGAHDYTENTDLFVFGALANYLFNYKRSESSLYVLIGFGLAVVSVDWEESSPTDTSLGTPLSGGGSKMGDDGSGAGSVLNLGLGHSFGSTFDLRLEAPIIIPFDGPGESAAVIPTFLLTAGIRF